MHANILQSFKEESEKTKYNVGIFYWKLNDIEKWPNLSSNCHNFGKKGHYNH